MPGEVATPPRPAQPRPRWNRVARNVLLGVGVTCIAAALLLKPGRPQPKPPVAEAPAPATPAGADPGVAFALPEFSLTGQDGRPFGKADLLGNVWVASFVFTRCTGPCPSVTNTMTRLQGELNLAGTPNLRFVTVTVDPKRDKPEELKKYAEKHKADGAKWHFLTGSESRIHELLAKSFKIQAGPTQNPHPTEGQEFDHSTRLVVVDKTGTIRGYFDGYPGPNDVEGEHYRESQAGLKALVAKLLAE